MPVAGWFGDNNISGSLSDRAGDHAIDVDTECVTNLIALPASEMYCRHHLYTLIRWSHSSLDITDG